MYFVLLFCWILNVGSGANAATHQAHFPEQAFQPPSDWVDRINAGQMLWSALEPNNTKSQAFVGELMMVVN